MIMLGPMELFKMGWKLVWDVVTDMLRELWPC